MEYPSSQYDAFGWSPLLRSSLDPAESYGLDYDSAKDATPSWFAVSFGNGNDGVSHTFPDYYVRTADPFKLAAAAMISSFKADYKARAAEAMTVDGESDYTISAVIYNPEDVEGEDETEEDEEDGGSYCDANGAWLICEVFRVDDMPPVMVIGDDGGLDMESDPFGKPSYMTLADAFEPEDLLLAAE
jgi:hypothetical protein